MRDELMRALSRLVLLLVVAINPPPSPRRRRSASLQCCSGGNHVPVCAATAVGPSSGRTSSGVRMGH